MSKQCRVDKAVITLTATSLDAVERLLERVERAGPAAWLLPALLLLASLPLVRLAVPVVPEDSAVLACIGMWHSMARHVLNIL